MSIVGGYPMPHQNYAPMGPTNNHGNIYSSYYNNPSPPGHQNFYTNWGYPSGGYAQELTGCSDYGVTGGFVVGPGSPPPEFDGGEYTIEMVDGCGRVVKRRSSANKKERRRTQSINNAFAELRDCIPNVPADTKLSKIKTLRLATSYIAYLMGVLSTDVQMQVPAEGFKAELPPKQKTPPEVIKQETENDRAMKKGRTGWPQAVWAQELNK